MNKTPQIFDISQLPQPEIESNERIPIAELACRTLKELEAGISLELDRIQTLSESHPLAGLDEVIGFMQEINIELLKNLAPMLIESAQQRATEFHTARKSGEVSRQESLAIGTLYRTQEAIVKLGVARSKVKQALETEYESRQTIPEPGQRALPESYVVIDIPAIKEPAGQECG